MTWRLMGNLAVIRDDIRRVYVPRPVFWTIGDEEHRHRVSDHNPADYGFGTVVAAMDVAFDPSSVNHARARKLVDACLHRIDLSYVIFDEQIWSAVRLWRPIPYKGSNPHRHHVHLSSRHTSAADRNRAHLIFKTTKV
jgi:hypothetical protein